MQVLADPRRGGPESLGHAGDLEPILAGLEVHDPVEAASEDEDVRPVMTKGPPSALPTSQSPPYSELALDVRRPSLAGSSLSGRAPSCSGASVPSARPSPSSPGSAPRPSIAAMGTTAPSLFFSLCPSWLPRAWFIPVVGVASRRSCFPPVSGRALPTTSGTPRPRPSSGGIPGVPPYSRAAPLLLLCTCIVPSSLPPTLERRATCAWAPLLRAPLVGR